MCRSCGKMKVKQMVEYGSGMVPDSYRTEREVLVVYSGSVALNVIGCRSGNRYLFAPGATRSMDVNDAKCLVESEGFAYGEEVDRVYSEADTATPKLVETVSGRDGLLHGRVGKKVRRDNEYVGEESGVREEVNGD